MSENKGNKEFLKKAPEAYWMASTNKTSYPMLENDLETDVAIIGGGMAGIMSAWMLAEKGLQVAIIEADRIVQGTSGHTTAKITSQHGLIYDKVKTKLGEEMARQYADANENAISVISGIAEENGIECDFQPTDAFIYTQDDKYIEKIVKEAKTASSLGLKASYRDSIALPFAIKAAVCFEGQAQFHPRKFLLSLADKFIKKGGKIFEKTRAVQLIEGNKPVIVTEHSKKVKAGNIVLASHYPFHDRPGLYFTRLYPERSYLLGVRIKDKYPGGMYITAEDPGRTVRAQSYNEGELILIGGEHHKTGHGENMLDHYSVLGDFAADTFDVEDIPFHWSAQDYTTTDEIPYIGHLTSKTPNIYVATGFGKWGMTNSAVAASMISDLIVYGKADWEEVYNPSRFTPGASAKNFVVENADVAKQLISGKLAAYPEDLDLKPGEGKIIELHGDKVGAFKDEDGKLHLIDSTCTHIGCELTWNSAERTWDCPCHGSRFTYEGEIVDGPALKSIKVDLKPKE